MTEECVVPSLILTAICVILGGVILALLIEMRCREREHEPERGPPPVPPPPELAYLHFNDGVIYFDDLFHGTPSKGPVVASAATMRCDGQVGRREYWACLRSRDWNGNNISDQEPSAVTLLDR